jgi:hypothetical protein
MPRAMRVEYRGSIYDEMDRKGVGVNEIDSAEKPPS